MLTESILERVPGLSEWMHWIDCRGLKKAAVTNAPKENARVMLAALGMDNWFDEIILGENCKQPKPHPDPYLDAIKILGVGKDEALICEDSPSGVPSLSPIEQLIICEYLASAESLVTLSCSIILHPEGLL